jgi:hypothetical protein
VQVRTASTFIRPSGSLPVNSYPVFQLNAAYLLQFRWLKLSVLIETMESLAILKQLAAGCLRSEPGAPR